MRLAISAAVAGAVLCSVPCRGESLTSLDMEVARQARETDRATQYLAACSVTAMKYVERERKAHHALPLRANETPSAYEDRLAFACLYLSEWYDPVLAHLVRGTSLPTSKQT